MFMGWRLNVIKVTLAPKLILRCITVSLKILPKLFVVIKTIFKKIHKGYLKHF